MERMEFPDSSVLASAVFDEATNRLTVVFKSGRSYDFFDIPTDVWTGLKKADSKGRYFTQNIKGKFKPKAL